MSRTSSNKLLLGMEYIANLSSTHVCKSFHVGVTKCKCIQDVQEHLAEVNKFFEEEIEEFWKNFLQSTCMKEVLSPPSCLNMFITLLTRNMMFCLPTIIHIYGLNQNAMTAARDLLIDRKTIGLSLLKKACWEDLKSNQKLYWTYSNRFGHQIAPMSPQNSSAGVILKKLGGLHHVAVE